MLATLEASYDAAPRPLAVVEDVGPFTVFVRSRPDGWPYYARPRLGLSDPVSIPDVGVLRARQRELGAPEAIEWVHETTPSALEAVRGGGLAVELCPLLVLDPTASTGSAPPAPPAPVVAAGLELRRLGAGDPGLGAVISSIHAGFSGSDEVAAPDARNRPELIDAGLICVVGAFLDGVAVGGGSHSPRGDTTELTGIAVLPRARRQGIGAALATALARDARAHGIRTVFLSAQDDAVAQVYERVGFRRVGTACVAQAE